MQIRGSAREESARNVFVYGVFFGGARMNGMRTPFARSDLMQIDSPFMPAVAECAYSRQIGKFSRLIGESGRQNQSRNFHAGQMNLRVFSGAQCLLLPHPPIGRGLRFSSGVD
ncbi:hypothetical protein PSP6_130241 [Paraburkholderia tropica]|nr:hypothetical protein PSP6_130241 [Paraburkholderia tropica]